MTDLDLVVIGMVIAEVLVERLGNLMIREVLLLHSSHLSGVQVTDQALVEEVEVMEHHLHPPPWSRPSANLSGEVEIKTSEWIFFLSHSFLL